MYRRKPTVTPSKILTRSLYKQSQDPSYYNSQVIQKLKENEFDSDDDYDERYCNNRKNTPKRTPKAKKSKAILKKKSVHNSDHQTSRNFMTYQNLKTCQEQCDENQEEFIQYVPLKDSESVLFRDPPLARDCISIKSQEQNYDYLNSQDQRKLTQSFHSPQMNEELFGHPQLISNRLQGNRSASPKTQRQGVSQRRGTPFKIRDVNDLERKHSNYQQVTIHDTQSNYLDLEQQTQPEFQQRPALSRMTSTQNARVQFHQFEQPAQEFQNHDARRSLYNQTLIDKNLLGHEKQQLDLILEDIKGFSCDIKDILRVDKVLEQIKSQLLLPTIENLEIFQFEMNEALMIDTLFCVTDDGVEVNQTISERLHQAQTEHQAFLIEQRKFLSIYEKEKRRTMHIKKEQNQAFEDIMKVLLRVQFESTLSFENLIAFIDKFFIDYQHKVMGLNRKQFEVWKSIMSENLLHFTVMTIVCNEYGKIDMRVEVVDQFKETVRVSFLKVCF
eukprot:403334182